MRFLCLSFKTHPLLLLGTTLSLLTSACKDGDNAELLAKVPAKAEGKSTLVKTEVIASGGVCGTQTGVRSDVYVDVDSDGKIGPADKKKESTVVCGQATSGITASPVVSASVNESGAPAVAPATTTPLKGDTGASGLNALLEMTNIPADGTDGVCKSGGKKIVSCQDANGDGSCKEEKSLKEEKVCNGTSQGILTELLGASEQCPAGGVKFSRWNDLNANGMLDEKEGPAKDSYVCNGLRLLTRKVSFAAGLSGADGTACPAGGVRTESGYNGVLGTDISKFAGFMSATNNELDTNEVISAYTSYACHGSRAAVEVSQIPADGTDTFDSSGVRCEAGGHTVKTCNDINANGSCGDAIDTHITSKKVCHGKSVGLVVSTEPEGAACPAGGKKLTRWNDYDGNGSLAGTAELATVSTETVCNGLKWLARSTLFAQGAGTTSDNTNCPAGGYRLEFGYDNVQFSNQAYYSAGTSGTLDTAEVSLTTYSCNGQRGQAVGVRIEPAEGTSADSCQGVGGKKFQSFVDAGVNGAGIANGTYDLGETLLGSPQYVCNGAAGANGTNGTNGTNGASALVFSTVEPAGANCEAGGYKLTTCTNTVDSGVNACTAADLNYLVTYSCHGKGGVGVNEGRLSLSSTASVPTSDVASSASLYFIPHSGNRISLYSDGVWKLLSFTQASVATTAEANKNYDVFAYDNNGAVSIELLAWTNNTTRATALADQDGVKVKSGDATRRWLGTVRTILSGANVRFTDTNKQRFVMNNDNSVQRFSYTVGNEGGWFAHNGTWLNICGSINQEFLAHGSKFSTYVGEVYSHINTENGYDVHSSVSANGWAAGSIPGYDYHYHTYFHDYLFNHGQHIFPTGYNYMNLMAYGNNASYAFYHCSYSRLKAYHWL